MEMGRVDWRTLGEQQQARLETGGGFPPGTGHTLGESYYSRDDRADPTPTESQEQTDEAEIGWQRGEGRESKKERERAR